MRFMIIVKATADTEAGMLPPQALLAPMASYHDELAKAARCHAMLFAEGIELVSSFHAETRFQTVGRVIEPGVNNF